jgi:hypothetical protein
MALDLRLKATRQALAMSGTNAARSLSMLAQQQAQHQAKLAELKILRVDIIKQLCQRGQMLAMVAGSLDAIEFQQMLIEAQITSVEADDCQALAEYAASVDKWAYRLNGDVMITSIGQIVALVRLWHEQGQPEPEIEPGVSMFH